MEAAWLTERAAALLFPLVVSAVLLALWLLSATRGWMSVQVLPPPALVAQTLSDRLLRSPSASADRSVVPNMARGPCPRADGC
ncbi:hypothetical protein [Azospirillum brasilense]|uniref:hypothetical protein n=1 Tax=Azospirillum brasilense TaxID=192 RepID=UPI00190DB070|nr:hypothetical protein [Azospirillum brasilense]